MTKARTPTPATTPAELRLLITELRRLAPGDVAPDLAFLCHAAADTIALLAGPVTAHRPIGPPPQDKAP